MRSTRCGASIYFVGLRLLLRVILAHEPLVVRLVGVVLHGVCLLILASATISPTFSMTIYCTLVVRLVMQFILDVPQGLVLCDGFIYGLDCFSL